MKLSMKIYNQKRYVQCISNSKKTQFFSFTNTFKDLDRNKKQKLITGRLFMTFSGKKK